MIILNLYCGLGNQMFEYAYALALSEEYGEDIYINKTWMKLAAKVENIKHLLHKEAKTSIEMVYTNHLFNQECGKNIKFLSFPNSFFHALKFELFLLYQYFFKNRENMYGEDKFKELSSNGYFVSYDGFSYFKHGKCKKKTKYLHGTFASEKYFDEISDKIKKNFTVTTEPSEKNKEMLKNITSSNSVCVHMRRGDFISNKTYSEYLNICNAQYYSDAIDYINSHVENPRFFIFSNNSDDLKWIKENYSFIPKKAVYVDLNNPDYEELRLMYNCNHFVTSNSTFSWWASYLSNNKNKIILVPDIYHNNKLFKGSVDIYRNDMKKIHVNLEDKK